MAAGTPPGRLAVESDRVGLTVTVTVTVTVRLGLAAGRCRFESTGPGPDLPGVTVSDCHGDHHYD